MRSKYVKNTITYVFLIIIFLITVFPLIDIIFASLKTNQEILTDGIYILPHRLMFENYRQAWTLANFKQFTWNSIYMTVFIIIGTLISSTMCAYLFSRGRFPGKKLIFFIMLGSMFLSLGNVTLYPLLDVAKLLHINTSLWGVIIIRVFGLNIPLIFLMRGYIDTISREIDEAATIDGCSFFRTYWQIMIPLVQPIVATGGLITFMAAWNDYLLPLVFTLSNPRNYPLIVGVVQLKSTGGDTASSWNLMMAGTAMSVLPMVVFYMFFNKYFISGLTSGAVKG